MQTVADLNETWQFLAYLVLNIIYNNEVFSFVSCWDIKNKVGQKIFWPPCIFEYNTGLAKIIGHLFMYIIHFGTTCYGIKL